MTLHEALCGSAILFASPCTMQNSKQRGAYLLRPGLQLAGVEQREQHRWVQREQQMLQVQVCALVRLSGMPPTCHSQFDLSMGHLYRLQRLNRSHRYPSGLC